MFSISQAVEKKMWSEAAEACASALSVLSKKEQLSMAGQFVKEAEGDLQKAARGRWYVAGAVLPPLPLSNHDELSPWSVHLADAKDEIKDIQGLVDINKDECSARTTGALWDVVFGLQVAAWAVSNVEDFQNWQSGRKADGVLASPLGNFVGTSKWLNLDQLIRSHKVFRCKTDHEIYEVRPAIFVFRHLMEESGNYPSDSE